MSISPTGDRHAAEIFGIDTPEEADRKNNATVYGARDNLLTRAQAIAARPYEGYSGERVAGLGGNELRGLNMAARGSEDSRAYLNKAGAQIDDVAGSAWNSETAKKYMDPYIGQVVDNTLRRENTAYQQNQNQLRNMAASRGAFGGDRATLLESQGTQKHLQTVGDLTAEGYSKAYSQAFQGWQADNDRKMRAASAYQSVGGDINQMERGQIQDLMMTGGTERVLRQLTNDTMYSSFIEKRDWDVTNLQPLLQAVSVAKGNQPQGGGQQGNQAGEVIGAISSIAGYFGSRGSGNKGPDYGGGYGNGGTNYDGGDIYGGGGAPDYSGT